MLEHSQFGLRNGRVVGERMEHESRPGGWQEAGVADQDEAHSWGHISYETIEENGVDRGHLVDDDHRAGAEGGRFQAMLGTR
ncbi:hypothetical protein TVD_10705 [Thioalkalivibrio versutus]|uniref:Uncharacterized protein n=1 Tax=Thioalkalivibrio versutus TaxID=106634 RepID=A0A0G3G8E0_9GAMM|nr:hypothetical protein TVD_10705 [Thioalkalivibrio versutus]